MLLSYINRVFEAYTNKRREVREASFLQLHHVKTIGYFEAGKHFSASILSRCQQTIVINKKPRLRNFIHRRSQLSTRLQVAVRTRGPPKYTVLHALPFLIKKKKKNCLIWLRTADGLRRATPLLLSNLAVGNGFQK